MKCAVRNQNVNTPNIQSRRLKYTKMFDPNENEPGTTNIIIIIYALYIQKCVYLNSFQVAPAKTIFNGGG